MVLQTHQKPPLCQHCGWNVRGREHEGDHCPECGSIIEAIPALQSEAYEDLMRQVQNGYIATSRARSILGLNPLTDWTRFGTSRATSMPVNQNGNF